MADIRTQVWSKMLAAALFLDNAFITKAVSHDAYVANHMVNLATAAVPPVVIRNRTGAVAAVPRTDLASAYTLDEFVTTPEIIDDRIQTEVAYDKRATAVEAHAGALNDAIADHMAFYWAPTDSSAFERTTGASRTASVAGATGTRKMITLDDILRLRRALDQQRVPQENRCLLLTSEMYNDLLTIDKVLSAEYNQTGKLPEGVVNKLFGFNIYQRQQTLSYTNAATPGVRVPGAAALTTANAAALAWHPNFVARAKGVVKVFTDTDNPTEFGSIRSTLCRAGGSPLYADKRGIVALIESATA